MTEIKPGVMLVIPGGADSARKRPYVLGVHTVLRVSNGIAEVWGDAYRLDMKPISSPGVLGRFAIIDTARVCPVTVPRKRGGQDKLNPAQKRAALAAKNAGSTVTDLAAKYGVHRVTMSKILTAEAAKAS